MAESQEQTHAQFAVFGCGGWGKNIVRTMNRLGFLHAIVDPSEHGQVTAKELAPEVPCYGDAKDIFNNDTIKGVMIATPAETHFAIAKEALLSGKDVYVEKPMTIDLAEARELVELAQHEGRLLMVGHLLEYHPAICKIESMIEEGVLGDIQYIVSNRLNLGKLRTEENVLWSFAPHDISVMLRLMKAYPTNVISTGGAFLTDCIADTALTQLSFESGAKGHVFVSWLNPFKEQKLTVIGSKNMMTFCDMTKTLTLHNQTVGFENGVPSPVKGDEEIVDFSDEMPLDLECKHFVESVINSTTPRTDGENGLRVLSILHDAQRSLDANGAVIQCVNATKECANA